MCLAGCRDRLRPEQSNTHAAGPQRRMRRAGPLRSGGVEAARSQGRQQWQLLACPLGEGIGVCTHFSTHLGSKWDGVGLGGWACMRV